MNKLVVAIFIISFWLVLPIPMQLMDLSNYEVMDRELTLEDNPTLLNYIGVSFTLLGTYIKMVFLWIPGVPNIINYFLWVLRLVSGLVVYLLIRGD